MITVIITETQGGIDSNHYWGYALKPTTEVEDTDIEDKGIALIACGDTEDDFRIATFTGKDAVSKAGEALVSLVNAIQDSKRSWDVAEFKHIIPF